MDLDETSGVGVLEPIGTFQQVRLLVWGSMGAKFTISGFGTQTAPGVHLA